MAGWALLYGLVNVAFSFGRRFCIKNALILGHVINIHGSSVYNKCTSLVQPVDCLARNIRERGYIQYVWWRSLYSATKWRSGFTAVYGFFKDMLVVFEWLPTWPTSPGFSTSLNSPRLRISHRNPYSLFRTEHGKLGKGSRMCFRTRFVNALD